MYNFDYELDKFSHVCIPFRATQGEKTKRVIMDCQSVISVLHKL